MGAEVGATTSTFGYDESMERYLRSTGRDDVADAANAVKEHLTADAEVYANPEQYKSSLKRSFYTRFSYPYRRDVSSS